MRGWYWALPLKEQDAERALAELGCREGFFPTAEDMNAHFVFAPAPEAGWTEIGVATEIGENLLAYAKMLGLLRFRKVGKTEN